MNVIIVDDEATVRNTIISMLKTYFPGINISAAVGSIEEAYKEIVHYKPDLVFLDIGLSDGNGFELIRKLNPPAFKVIFVTGHQEFALDAIKVSALDYLLKPVDSEEFCTSIKKAMEVINHKEQEIKLQALSENLQSRKKLKRIILHNADNLQLISITDIVRAEADSNYTRFTLSDGKHILVSRTIKEFDKLLSGSGMVRVHQSHLVNINFIDKYVRKDGAYLILKDGTKIPVSPNLKKQILEALTEQMYE